MIINPVADQGFGDLVLNHVKRSSLLRLNTHVLTVRLRHTADAKTAPMTIRESNKFKIVGFIDQASAGKDAGEVLDGKNRQLPVFATIEAAAGTGAEYCIVGVATTGGIFPESMLNDIRTAIKQGMSIVNGLHDYLNDRPDMVELAQKHEVELIDIRRPKSR